MAENDSKTADDSLEKHSEKLPNANEKQSQSSDNKDDDDKSKGDKNEKKPPGGHDSTPIPQREPGWTIKITFIRATNLPIADINSLSSDPFIVAEMRTGLPQRHKQDPPLLYRTHTIRESLEPKWNSEWIVANIPSSGFQIKARLYDEDPADHDDRLGNVHIHVNNLSEGWKGMHEQAYNIKKRMGSKRAYLVKGITTCFGKSQHMGGQLFISIELLGRTEDKNGGRAYTIGPVRWFKHYSPLLGRVTGMKEDESDKHERDQHMDSNSPSSPKKGDGQKSRKKSNTQQYNFQANQIQLAGPVPEQLYHRYVEFKPFVRGMFTNKGIQGFLLHKAMHHQHQRVYNYDRSTIWGQIPPESPEAITKRFLELVHYDRGGRIFTYVLTLDALIRFTETGKEFKVDMLSKHTMHSDVSIYIAFSGEFFVRKRKRRDQGSSNNDGTKDNSGEYQSDPSKDENKGSTLAQTQGPNPSKPLAGQGGKRDDKESKTGHVDAQTPIAAETTDDNGPSTNPCDYELYIDNDSGTYRPDAKLLPLLKEFMEQALPGIHVRTLDCQKDADKMNKLKTEQREAKKAAQGGKVGVYKQGRRDSSSSGGFSSSDEEDLDDMEQSGGTDSEPGVGRQVLSDAKQKASGRLEYWKGLNPKRERPEITGGGEQSLNDDEKSDQGRAIGNAEKEPS